MSIIVTNTNDADDEATAGDTSEIAKMPNADRFQLPKFTPVMRTYSCESSFSDRLVLQKFELDRVTRQFNTVRDRIRTTNMQPPLPAFGNGEMTVTRQLSSGSSEKIRAMKHEIMELRATVDFQQQQIVHQREVIRDLEQQQHDIDLPMHLNKMQQLLVVYKNYATILEAEHFGKSPLDVDPHFNAKGQTIGNGFVKLSTSKLDYCT